MDSSKTLKGTGAVLFVIAFSSLLATFNETFLNVALTPIMADLAVDANTVQWVATAYMLCAAIMVPITGFLYRSVPVRRLMVIALLFLLAGTLVGVMAPTFAVLLVGRIIQAIGTGMLVPLGMNLTLVVAPEGRLGTYMGTVSAMTTLGPALGPIVAGGILAAFSWHALFAFFAVLVVACLVCAARLVPNVTKLTHPRLDVPSVALISIALIGLLYGISTLFSGLIGPAVAALVVGVVFLVLFVARQRKVAEPLLDLRPFGNPVFVLGLIVVAIALMTVFSMNMILPVFMQGALGFTALGAALTLLPACIASCILSPLAGKVYDRFGVRVMVPVGLAFVAVFAFCLSRLGVGAASWQIVLFYLPVIIGVSLTMGPAQSFALSSLDRSMYSHGVTIVSTTFQIAGCLGSSLFMGILSLVQGQQLAEGAGVDGAMAAGFQAACLLATALGVIGFVIALVLGRHEKQRRASNASAATDEAPVRTEAGEPGALGELMEREVWTVSQDATVLEAAELLVANRITGTMVEDGAGKIVGFISDGDITRALAKQTPLFQSAWSFLVEHDDEQFDALVRRVLNAPVMDIATHGVIGVQADDDLETICKVMTDHRLKKAPVFRDGRMIGVVNRSNITQYALATYLRDQRADR